MGDIEAVFRERWDDPSPLSRNPIHRLRDIVDRTSSAWRPLLAPTNDPSRCGRQAVQVLRTYPPRRRALPFAPEGERSVARGITKALGRARRLVYVEDQYLWSRQAVAAHCQALRAQPELLLVAVVSPYPDQDGHLSTAPNLIGRVEAMRALAATGGRRVAVYGLENSSGIPIYVHAKLCIVDDDWAKVGSDNVNRRSWTHDSELACAVVDVFPEDSTHRGEDSFARDLRLRMAREHLDRAAGDDGDLLDPGTFFDTFADAAERLEAWYRDGGSGLRPPGRLRPLTLPRLSCWSRLWSSPVYRLVYDPDGRRRSWRKAGRY